jgi:CRP/FNR family transcriptional regulator, cyclic AMP receptor protein
MAGERRERVGLLAVEPEFGRRIPPADLPLARRHLTAQLIDLPPGPVALDPLPPELRPPFGAIVVEGLLLRQVTVMGHDAVQLLGPGDLVALDSDDGVLLPRTITLTCSEVCTLGALDDQLLIALRRWPDVAAVFVERADEQLDRLAVQHAIGQMPRVQDRILATLWHLAERHGRVTASGVHLPITLTHRLLGRLVGARRPTVSLALTELEDDGAIGRRADRTWMLLQPPAEIVIPATLPGDVATVRAPITAAPRPEPAPRWSEEARGELLATVERMHRIHAETAHVIAERLERYKATRNVAEGARRRAEETRHDHPRSAA